MTKQKEQPTIFEEPTSSIPVRTGPMPSTTPAMLLEKAIEKGLGLQELEKLMELQERWEARQAEKAFNEALSSFQEDCPKIVKTKSGYENRYQYAPLGEIDDVIKPIMAKHGLNKRWEFEDFIDEKDGKPKVRVICVVTHKDGHSQRTSMSAGHDGSGSKNAIQAHGSSLTYQQRYTLIGALGLTTTDNDPDGKGGPKEKQRQEPDVPQFDQIIARAKSGKLDEKKMRAAFILNDEQERQLMDILDNLPKK